MKTEPISVKTGQREELVDITPHVQKYVDQINLKNGIIIIYVPHTTAAVTINEHADPSVARDIIYKLAREIPKNENYRHAEGNSDAHIKSSLVGASIQVIISDGRLLLGTWQGIFFCEFDGPRTRKVYLKAVSD